MLGPPHHTPALKMKLPTAATKLTMWKTPGAVFDEERQPHTLNGKIIIGRRVGGGVHGRAPLLHSQELRTREKSLFLGPLAGTTFTPQRVTGGWATAAALTSLINLLLSTPNDGRWQCQHSFLYRYIYISDHRRIFFPFLKLIYIVEIKNKPYLMH